MKYLFIVFISLCTTTFLQAQIKPVLVNGTFEHVEKKLNLYTTPLDAGDMALTAMKDDAFLSMEYKQKADDNALMAFYSCSLLKKEEFLTEVKGNLILKTQSTNQQQITVEITEGTSSSGRKIKGKDIKSLGVLEQDIFNFIKK